MLDYALLVSEHERWSSDHALKAEDWAPPMSDQALRTTEREP
jgi:hypothetical protein